MKRPPARRRTWREKLQESHGLPRTIRPGRRPGGPPGNENETMVIPSPLEVDGLIRGIRRGRTATVAELCVKLARRHGTDRACPLTTGIFAWIAAHAAAEAEAEGRRRVTPWWRVLKPGGKLNPKYPGGVREQARRLAAEGWIAPPAPPRRGASRTKSRHEQ